MAKKDAEVIVSTSNHPLLVFGNSGKGRIMAWTTDIGPHW
jgi:uncharacterized membrane protein